MVARSGDRQGAFGHLLASDIDEIQIVLGVAVVDLFESAWDRIDFQGAGHDKNVGTVPGFLMSILARKCFASAGTVPGFLPGILGLVLGRVLSRETIASSVLREKTERSVSRYYSRLKREPRGSGGSDKRLRCSVQQEPTLGKHTTMPLAWSLSLVSCRSIRSGPVDPICPIRLKRFRKASRRLSRPGRSRHGDPGGILAISRR
jgi:hypothetical protein